MPEECQLFPWNPIPLAALFRINTAAAFPSQSPNEFFTHYSIPAFDKLGGPANELGSTIESNKTSISEPSVLVSKLNPRKPRVVAVQDPKDRTCCSTEFVCYVPLRESDDLRYWSAYFGSGEFSRRLERVAVGSTNSHTRVSPSETLKWLVPDVPAGEQKRIADILDAIDDAVLATDEVLAKLALVHQGLVHDLTTLGVNEKGEIRHADQAEDFHETELGALPVSWGVDSVGRMANDLALGTAARGANDGKDQLRLLKMGNLGWDTLDTSVCELIDVERVVRWRDAVLVDGDLLFNTRNTPELVGKTAAYDQDDDRTVCDNNILRIRFPDEKMDGRLAAAYMANGLGKSRLLALATGTTSVAAIYWRDLRDFKLPVPPREEREEIVRRLQCSRDRIRREKVYRAKLSDLREGLRDDLLTGRKPVMAIREAAE